jgi:uncharacterized protein with HEPN domain
MLPEADAIRLRHMLAAAEEAMEFAQGRSREDLDTDRMLSRAVVRDIEIVGEAASQVTAETRKGLPTLPWPSIVGMRHRLVHGYFDIDLDRVWDTLIDDLPPLISELRRLKPMRDASPPARAMIEDGSGTDAEATRKPKR